MHSFSSFSTLLIILWLKIWNNNFTYTRNDLIRGLDDILSWTNKWSVLGLEA
jgi:hypothetical protein